MASILHVRSRLEPRVDAVDRLRAEGVQIIEAGPVESDVEAGTEGGVEAVLIGPEIDAPVNVARAVHRAHPDAHIVFVTNDAGEPRLRRDLLLAPRIGTHWSVTRPEAAEDAIRSALGASLRRRQLRDALGRMNVRITQPPTTPKRPILSEYFLASVLNQLSDGVVAVDTTGTVITYNRAAGRMFGRSLRAGAPFEIEDGEIVSNGASIEIRSTSVTDEGGRILGRAIVARDVTERHRAAAQRDYIAAAVAKLSSTLEVDAILQQLADLVIDRFASVCVIDISENETIERRAVAARQELTDLASRMRQFAPDPAVAHPSVEAIRTGETIVLNDATPDALRHIATAPGHPELLEELGICAYAAVPLRAGIRTVGAVLFGRETPFAQDEITAVEELARNATTALHNAWVYEAAEEANRAKDEFLATLSHELRTPMTSILGWIQMLRMGELDMSTTDEAMAAIEQSARMQAQLIDDLLDLSRIQMGKLHLQVSDTDLASVARAAVDTILPAANAKRIAVDLIVAPDIPHIPADPNRLQQVIWNLLSNAVKFTEKGGRVSVELDSFESKIRLRVTDTGQGIEPEFLPYVFERFRQADSSITRRFGGLGLGLSIVRQIVELHGGSVTASSDGPEKGTTFTVTLPIAPVREGAAAHSEQEGLADLHGARILVVDDEPSAARVVAAVLTHAGAEVETRPSVASALEAIRAQRPDLIISDLAMPDEDGFALIGYVRNILRCSPEQLPAIALTAVGDMDTRVRILGAGFQRYVRKPVDAHQLCELVAATLGR